MKVFVGLELVSLPSIKILPGLLEVTVTEIVLLSDNGLGGLTGYLHIEGLDTVALGLKFVAFLSIHPLTTGGGGGGGGVITLKSSTKSPSGI